MIGLRQLQEKDALFMLEWMHDPDIPKWFRKRMQEASMDDVLHFIRESRFGGEVRTGQNLHFAIVDSNDDTYLGTVSLKEIDLENGSAEYAIITRKAIHGLGIAHMATQLILKKAFYEIGLHRVYLSVYSNNTDAIRLYERCGFKYEGEFRDHFFVEGEYVNWKWYGILKDEFIENNV